MEYQNPLTFDQMYMSKYFEPIEYTDENFKNIDEKYSTLCTSSHYYNHGNELQESNMNQYLTESKIYRPDLNMCQFYLDQQLNNNNNQTLINITKQNTKKIPFQYSEDMQALHREQLQLEKQLAQQQQNKNTNDSINEAIKAFNEIENDSEDEGIEDYKQGGYHPVHVGEVLHQRYVTIQKLGWGHFSTVWLSKDFKYNTYVAIKVQKSADHYIEAAYDEVEILQKVAEKAKQPEWIDSLKDYYQNQKFHFNRDDCHVVQLLNSFVYRGPYGNHFCMVFEILGVNLLEIIKRYEFKGIPLNICKKIAKQTLIGLDYLHRICNVIHTDLKPENVMIQLSQDEIRQIIENGQLNKNQVYEERLKVFHQAFNIYDPKQVQIEQEQEQQQELKQQYGQRDGEKENIQQQKGQKLTKGQKKNLKRRQQKKQKQMNTKGVEQQFSNQQTDEQVESNHKKEVDYKQLFQSNKEKISFKQTSALPQNFQIKVADLGNACWTHHHFSTLIQTRQYRSPETIVGISYNQTADLWSFACMLFELITGDFLFEPRKGAHFSKNDDHLAQIQELMGKFPLKFTQSAQKSKRYFNRDGSQLRIPQLNCWSLENVLIEKYKFKLNEAKQLASFLVPMLNPFPHERIQARESLSHSWLQIDGDDTYDAHMNENELRQWQETKEILIQNDQYRPHNRQNFYESEEDFGDHSVENTDFRSLQQNYQPKKIMPRQTDMVLIDRSFTDLGYIGFENGIDIQQLDSTGNWQFTN